MNRTGRSKIVSKSKNRNTLFFSRRYLLSKGFDRNRGRSCRAMILTSTAADTVTAIYLRQPAAFFKYQLNRFSRTMPGTYAARYSLLNDQAMEWIVYRTADFKMLLLWQSYGPYRAGRAHLTAQITRIHAFSLRKIEMRLKYPKTVIGNKL